MEKIKQISIIVLQIALIHLFLFLAIGIKALIPIPLPTTIIGIFLLFLSLQLRWIKLEWVEKGGKFLIAELLLFFIPSAVGIVNYQELFGLEGIFVVLVILLSTALVMALTGLLAEWIGGKKSWKSS